MAVEEETTPWIFNAEQLENTPSRIDGISKVEESKQRKQVCRMIQELACTQEYKIKATPTATNSAKVFFHRVFMAQSLKRQNPKLVGVTCLFVACKSEECLRQLKYFIWALNSYETDPVTKHRIYPYGRSKNPDKPPAEIEEDTKEFQSVRHNILAMERVVLEILGFEFNVDHPTVYLVRLIKFFDTVKRDKESRCLVTADEDGGNAILSELGQRVLATANEAFKVLKMSKLEAALNEEWRKDPDQRFNTISIKKEEVDDACSQLLDLYDQNDIEEKARAQGAPAAASAPPSSDTLAIASAHPHAAASSSTGSSGVSPKGSNNHAAHGAQNGGAGAPGHTTGSNGGGAAVHVQNHQSSGAGGGMGDQSHLNSSMKSSSAMHGPPKPHQGTHTSAPPYPAPQQNRPPGQRPPPPAGAGGLKDQPELKRKLDAGEKVTVNGSAGKVYELQRKGDVYSCTCSIWRHIADLESRRTCKHLQSVRGHKFELGRVGEDGVKKADEIFNMLMQQQQQQMSTPPVRPPGGGAPHGAPPPGSQHGKRPADPAAQQNRDPKRQAM